MYAYYYSLKYFNGIREKNREGIIVENSYSEASRALIDNYGGEKKKVNSIYLEKLGDSRILYYDLTEDK